MAQAAHLWKEWGVQVLVLFSFTLQVTLLILAEFRRRVDSGVLRFFTWSAYQLADATAIYVLGHMSVTSRSSEHELVAFWAPFLLMHLGGQDNITAYAIEDNKLWLRHLQTLVVQVAGAAYVVYASSILSSHPLLQVAVILMFVVGAVKYGERVWALRCASSSGSNNYQGSRSGIISAMKLHFIHRPSSDRSATEDTILLGHEMLDAPKDFIKGPIPYDLSFVLEREVKRVGTIQFRLSGEQAYNVSQLQVSLMHDVFYTKAESQSGWIRIMSSLATTVALSLLIPLLSGKSERHNDSYKKVDVVITYVLSVGAAVLEATSLMRFILSSFNWSRLERMAINSRQLGHRGRPRTALSSFRTQMTRIEVGLLRPIITSLRRLVHAADWRVRHSWSRSMGQHNLFQLCARSKTSRRSKMARRMGVEDWWNTLASSWSIPVSLLIEQLVTKQVMESCDISKTSPDHILNSRGRAVLKRKSQQLYDDLRWSVDHDSLSMVESILLWHIATDLYLRWYKDQPKASSSSSKDNHLAEAVEALSNYMLFLVAARPDMLPPTANRSAYVDMCYLLTNLDYISAEELAGILQRNGDALLDPKIAGFSFPFPAGKTGQFGPIRESLKANTALSRGCKLATKLTTGESPSADTLELIGQVWAEMLCYMGNRCSAYAHAKQLSDGGELITVAAFLVEYLKRNLLKASTEVADAV